MIYDIALQNLLKKEGGLSTNAADRGGATIHGVSSKYFPQDFQALKDLTEKGDQDAVNAYLNQFYKKNFWDPVGAGQMDPQMAQVAFDTAVNQGVGAAKDMISLSGGDPAKVLQQRQERYIQLAQNDPTQAQFLNGWKNRVDALADETGVINDASPELPPGFTLIEDDKGDTQQPSENVNYFTNLANQAAQGLTFGFSDEMFAGLDKMLGVPEDEINQKLSAYRSSIKQGSEQAPVSSFIANVAGAIPTGMGVGGAVSGVTKSLAPSVAKAAGTFAASHPGATAALLGAGGNALYGQGTRDGRAQNLLDNTVLDAGVGGILGFLGHRAVDGAGKFISSLRKSPEEAVAAAGGLLGDAGLVQKASDEVAQATVDAAQIASSSPIQSTEITPLKLAGILDEEALARMERGNVIPLTQGQKSQNPVIQRMENKALIENSTPMKQAVSNQMTAAYKPFQGLLGDAQELQKEALGGRSIAEVERAVGMLRDKYDEMGKQVTKAYEIADEMGGIKISGPAVKDDLIGNIDEFLSADRYRSGDIPGLDVELSDLRNMIKSNTSEKVIPGMYSNTVKKETSLTPADIGKLEGWKKRINKLINETSFEKKDTLRVLKSVGRIYDDFLVNVADNAIITDDAMAIDAFKNARSLASKKFSFFDADSVVSRVLENRELGGENLVNLVIGAGKVSNKGDSGNIIGKMISIAGDRAPEMQDAMRKGVMARVLKNSVTSTVDQADQTRSVISWPKMRSAIGDLMTNNKEMFQTLFNEKEQEYWKMMHKDLIKLGSQQMGSFNNSSSGSFVADTLLNLSKIADNGIVKTGTLGVSTPIGAFINMQAKSVLDKKLESGLSDLLNETISAYSTPAVYWGGGLGGTFGTEGAGLMGSSLFSNEYVEDENTKKGAE